MEQVRRKAGASDLVDHDLFLPRLLQSRGAAPAGHHVRKHQRGEGARQMFFASQDLELATSRQACTIQDLLNIRAHNSQWLRQHTVGSAVGVRYVAGRPTDTPAVIAFVPSKVARRWVVPEQLLPARLQGRGSVWCDLDVMEFNPAAVDAGRGPEEFVFNHLVNSLRGSGDSIGPGSQVMSESGTYASMGPLVRPKHTPAGESSAPSHDAAQRAPTGFLTSIKMFEGSEDPRGCAAYHPQTPALGMGVEVGRVEATFATASDVEWYGSFLCEHTDPQVHVDAAYVAFTRPMEERVLRRDVPGLPGPMGPVMEVSVRKHPCEVACRKVLKIGRSTGITRGTILAYAVEYYSDDAGIPYNLDFLIESSDDRPFSDKGDTGGLLLVEQERSSTTPFNTDDTTGHWRPLGLVWSFSSKCGRTHTREARGPVHWNSAVELAKVLKRLDLEMCM